MGGESDTVLSSAIPSCTGYRWTAFKSRRSFSVSIGIWVVTLVVGRYFFGNVPLVRDHMGSFVLLGVGVGVGVGSLVISAAVRFFKSHKKSPGLSRPGPH